MGEIHTYLDGLRIDEVKDSFVNFINTNSASDGYFPDPYVLQTSRSRSTNAKLARATEKFKLIGIFPHIEVACEEISSVQLTSKQRSFTQERIFNIRIYFFNQKGHKYAYDSKSFADERLNSLFLQLISNAILEHNDEMDEVVHNISIGAISNPVHKDNYFVGVLPLTCKSFHKFGGYTRG